MMGLLVPFLAGALFAVGLVVGGMTLPGKVIGFLDFAGAWDPSLLFVMSGGLLVHGLLYRLVMRRSSPLLAAKFHVPSRRDIDRRLVLGAAIFGVGWGLGGYCPGPGLVSLTSGALPVVFVASVIAGIYAERLVDRIKGSFS